MEYKRRIWNLSWYHANNLGHIIRQKSKRSGGGYYQFKLIVILVDWY